MNYRVTSYNTSVLNAMRKVDAHPFLSESASLIAKYQKMNTADATSENDTDVFKEKVLAFGGELDDRINTYLLERMPPSTQKQTTKHILCLIEQTIFVPDNYHHAYYEDLDHRKQYQFPKDSIQTPSNMGILKRITALKAIDVSVVGNESLNANQCVFDNVLNTQNSTAEGIAIFFSGNVFDKKVQWDLSANPNFKVYQTLLNSENNVETRKIHFFSEDMGLALCGENYRKENDAMDLGRPFIMTAGTDRNNNLVIIVAFHGPNFSKLRNIHDKKMSIDTIKKEMSTAMADTLRYLIQKGITNATNLKTIWTDTERKDKQVHVIIGCDSNDTDKQFYDQFTKTEQTIMIDGTEKIIYYKYNDLKADQITCCANCDSSFPNTDKPGKCEGNGLNPVSIETLTKVNDPTIYSPDFLNTANYKNYGDYIIAGSSVPKDVENQNFTRNDVPYIKDHKEVSSSDHFAVESDIGDCWKFKQPPFTSGGTNNRRRSTVKKQRKTRRRSGGPTRLQKRRKNRSRAK